MEKHLAALGCEMQHSGMRQLAPWLNGHSNHGRPIEGFWNTWYVRECFLSHFIAKLRLLEEGVSFFEYYLQEKYVSSLITKSSFKIQIKIEGTYLIGKGLVCSLRV